MIINTGSRTDIPAFFSDWFYNRIQAGYVLVRSPFNPQLVTRYQLDPTVVDAISFCTKNPAPMLDRLHELDAFRTFFMVTITPYGREIEPFVPDPKKVIQSFAVLSEYSGRNAVSWRYDPIFISEKYSVEFHKQAFAQMAEALHPYTDQCVVSFIDLYAKTRRNFPEARPVTRAQQEELVASFAQTVERITISEKRGPDFHASDPAMNEHKTELAAQSEGESPHNKEDRPMQIHLCLEDASLVRPHVDAEGCFSQAVLEKAIGRHLNVPRLTPARTGCSCLLGADIGVYNTCGHGCRYCYANYDRKVVEENLRQHDPESPLLIGHLRDTDVIHDAKQSSWIDEQMNIFDFL